MLIVTFLITSSPIWAQAGQFGGSTANTCSMLKQAVEKFATFTPDSDLLPIWAQKILTLCWLRVNNSRQSSVGSYDRLTTTDS